MLDFLNPGMHWDVCLVLEISFVSKVGVPFVCLLLFVCVFAPEAINNYLHM